MAQYNHPSPTQAEIREDRIFQDKLRVTRMIVEYEVRLITDFNSLIRRMRIGEIEESNLKVEGEYSITWQLVGQISDDFEFDKHNMQKVIDHNENDYKQFEEIHHDYRYMKSVSFESFRFCYGIVRKIMQLSGFHDIALKAEADGEFESEEY